MPLSSQMKKEMIKFGMKAYFDAYRKRWPHKGVEDAIRATRNYIEGYFRGFENWPLTLEEVEAIEKKLNELRLES